MKKAVKRLLPNERKRDWFIDFSSRAFHRLDETNNYTNPEQLDRSQAPKVKIHAVSHKVIELVANCKDWARRRQRKAPAKMHLRLEPHNFLPSVAIVDTAGQLDEPPARELCVGPLSGVIVVPEGQ